MLTTDSPETENMPGEQETFSKRACRSSLRVPWHAVSIALIRQDQIITSSGQHRAPPTSTRGAWQTLPLLPQPSPLTIHRQNQTWARTRTHRPPCNDH